MNQNGKPEMSPPEQQPIGFWTAAAGDAIRARTRGRLADEVGISQPEWWALHQLSLHPAGRTMQHLVDVIGPNESDAAIVAAVHGLRDRGLVRPVEDRWTLSDRGRAAFEHAAGVQRELHDERMHGISQADFATTIRVLQQTVRNVGGTAWHW